MQIESGLKEERDNANGPALLSPFSNSGRDASSLSLASPSTNDSRKSSRDIEERRKMITSRLNEERKTKEERLRESQRIADGNHARLIEERRKQQDEKRRREEERFRIVQERRRRQEELARARLQQLLDTFRQSHDSKASRRTLSTPRQASARSDGADRAAHRPDSGSQNGGNDAQHSPKENGDGKIPRSQSNIDRLATPRSENRNRIGHKYCLMSTDDLEMMRGPFSRRARSTSRSRKPQRRNRTTSASRHVCCEHCDTGAAGVVHCGRKNCRPIGCCEHCAPSKWFHCVLDCKRGTPVHRCCKHCDAPSVRHCAKLTCGHKAAHCCCSHCETANAVHCNDARCHCLKHAHNCCPHCDVPHRVHCAATACSHSRVHHCCEHCVSVGKDKEKEKDKVQRTEPLHCSRRECELRHSPVHHCCSHCVAANSLHCAIRGCKARFISTPPPTRKEVSQSEKAPARKLDNQPRSAYRQNSGDKPDVAASRPRSERRTLPAASPNVASQASAPRSAKGNETPMKRTPKHEVKTPTTPGVMSKSLTSTSTPTPTPAPVVKSVKKPDSISTSKSEPAIKKQQESAPVSETDNLETQPQKTPDEPVSVQEPDGNGKVSTSIQEIGSPCHSPAHVDSAETVQNTLADGVAATEEFGHDEAMTPTLEDSMVNKELERAAVSKFEEERNERRKRVDSILRSRVKASSPACDSTSAEGSPAGPSVPSSPGHVTRTITSSEDVQNVEDGNKLLGDELANNEVGSSIPTNDQQQEVLADALDKDNLENHVSQPEKLESESECAALANGEEAARTPSANENGNGNENENESESADDSKIGLKTEVEVEAEAQEKPVERVPDVSTSQATQVANAIESSAQQDADEHTPAQAHVSIGESVDQLACAALHEPAEACVVPGDSTATADCEAASATATLTRRDSALANSHAEDINNQLECEREREHKQLSVSETETSAATKTTAIAADEADNRLECATAENRHECNEESDVHASTSLQHEQAPVSVSMPSACADAEDAQNGEADNERDSASFEPPEVDHLNGAADLAPVADTTQAESPVHKSPTPPPMADCDDLVSPTSVTETETEAQATCEREEAAISCRPSEIENENENAILSEASEHASRNCFSMPAVQQDQVEGDDSQITPHTSAQASASAQQADTAESGALPQTLGDSDEEKHAEEKLALVDTNCTDSSNLTESTSMATQDESTPIDELLKSSAAVPAEAVTNNASNFTANAKAVIHVAEVQEGNCCSDDADLQATVLTNTEAEQDSVAHSLSTQLTVLQDDAHAHALSGEVATSSFAAKPPVETVVCDSSDEEDEEEQADVHPTAVENGEHSDFVPPQQHQAEQEREDACPETDEIVDANASIGSQLESTLERRDEAEPLFPTSNEEDTNQNVSAAENEDPVCAVDTDALESVASTIAPCTESQAPPSLSGQNQTKRDSLIAGEQNEKERDPDDEQNHDHETEREDRTCSVDANNVESVMFGNVAPCTESQPSAFTRRPEPNELSENEHELEDRNEDGLGHEPSQETEREDQTRSGDNIDSETDAFASVAPCTESQPQSAFTRCPEPNELSENEHELEDRNEDGLGHEPSQETEREDQTRSGDNINSEIDAFASVAPCTESQLPSAFTESPKPNEPSENERELEDRNEDGLGHEPSQETEREDQTRSGDNVNSEIDAFASVAPCTESQPQSVSTRNLESPQPDEDEIKCETERDDQTCGANIDATDEAPLANVGLSAEEQAPSGFTEYPESPKPDDDEHEPNRETEVDDLACSVDVNTSEIAALDNMEPCSENEKQNQEQPVLETGAELPVDGHDETEDDGQSPEKYCGETERGDQACSVDPSTLESSNLTNVAPCTVDEADSVLARPPQQSEPEQDQKPESEDEHESVDENELWNSVSMQVSQSQPNEHDRGEALLSGAADVIHVPESERQKQLCEADEEIEEPIDSLSPSILPPKTETEAEADDAEEEVEPSTSETPAVEEDDAVVLPEVNDELDNAEPSLLPHVETTSQENDAAVPTPVSIEDESMPVASEPQAQTHTQPESELANDEQDPEPEPHRIDEADSVSSQSVESITQLCAVPACQSEHEEDHIVGSKDTLHVDKHLNFVTNQEENENDIEGETSPSQHTPAFDESAVDKLTPHERSVSPVDYEGEEETTQDAALDLPQSENENGVIHRQADQIAGIGGYRDDQLQSESQPHSMKKEISGGVDSLLSDLPSGNNSVTSASPQKRVDSTFSNSEKEKEKGNESGYGYLADEYD